MMRAGCGIAFDVCARRLQRNRKWRPTATTRSLSGLANDWYRPPAITGVAVAGLSVVGDSKGGREIKHGHARLDLYECAKAVGWRSRRTTRLTLALAI
jgi:hypothetical protein